MCAYAPQERPEEGLLVAPVIRDPQIGVLQKPCVNVGICVMFETGMAASAFLTKRVPTLTPHGSDCRDIAWSCCVCKMASG